MTGLGIVAVLAVMNMSATSPVPQPPVLDSVGAAPTSVPITARKAIGAFIHSRERFEEPQFPRQEFKDQRRYFLHDFDGDGSVDVAAVYVLRVEGSMGDDEWLLLAFGPRYRKILHTQVGTANRNRCRYARVRGVRGGRIEFYTLYYEREDTPMCCPSVPGRTSYSYNGIDLVEDDTIIDWASRMPPGEPFPSPSPWRWDR